MYWASWRTPPLFAATAVAFLLSNAAKIPPPQSIALPERVSPTINNLLIEETNLCPPPDTPSAKMGIVLPAFALSAVGTKVETSRPSKLMRFR